MNRLELRTELRAELGETAENFWKETELNAWLDEATRRFTAEQHWPWLVREFTDTVLAGDPDYSLEAVLMPRHVNLMLTPASGTNPIDGPLRVSPEEGFKLRRLYPSSGTPEYYYLHQSTPLLDGSSEFSTRIKFVPTPSEDYDLEVQLLSTPTPMTDDADEPEIPLEYQYAIVAWAAFKAWNKELRDTGKAQISLGEYQQILEQASREFGSIPSDTILAWGGGKPVTRGSLFPDDSRSRQIGTLG